MSRRCAGDITVKSGSESKAYYAPGLNELTTQWGNPPLGYEDLAQILHECTHTIVDINKWNALRLHDEVAGYLTFYTYAVIRNPVPLPAVKPGQHLSPDARLTFAFKQIVFKYGLHETRGFGAAINPKDSAMLMEAVHAHPEYSDLRDDQRTPEEYLGVPDKHLEMEKAKANWIWHTHPAPSQRRQ